ncbi:Cof-type HAD-IIB family hydrolase [Massilibacterium senegalense]|uniref:Cof-type HAD-IIB family hydrolase n=1 Tax=Massilibacterium senegalense TaxID=1632858 RepID=UPI000781D53B|nr:Cof-type HAD-IIB family hydrolase [Massilibacterium senegalense]
MAKKLVLFDIDGTLLDRNKQLPSSAKEAIFALHEKDIDVAIATGRAPFMFQSIREELKIDTFISVNGQYVVYKGEIIYENPLHQSELDKLEQFSNERQHPMVFLDEKKMVANCSYHPFVEESIASLKMPHPPHIANFHQENVVYQALVCCEQEAQRMYEQTFPKFDFIRWHEYSIDVLPKGQSKAKGIVRLLDQLQINLKDVYAFGDGLNDIEMMKTVGVAVAMENGKEETKCHADFITDTPENDGIYKGLKKLALI